MVTPNLERACQELVPELFSFARIFTDSDAECENLIWKSLEGVGIEKKALLENLTRTIEPPCLEEYRVSLLAHLYLLAGRHKLRQVDSLFHTLEHRQRAALYLHHRTSFPLETIADIIDGDKSSVMASLHGAREKMGLSSCFPLGEKRTCLFLRQISALVDSDSERYPFLVKHIRGCDLCRNYYRERRKSIEALTNEVPKHHIPRDLQRNFEARMGSFLRETLPSPLKKERSPFMRDLFGAFSTDG